MLDLQIVCARQAAASRIRVIMRLLPRDAAPPPALRGLLALADGEEHVVTGRQRRRVRLVGDALRSFATADPRGTTERQLRRVKHESDQERRDKDANQEAAIPDPIILLLPASSDASQADLDADSRGEFAITLATLIL